jgi:tricorn protease-like protein
MRYRLSFLLPPAAMALCAFGGATWAQADRTVAEIVPQLGHSSFVSSLAISADGRLALTGSDDRSMILWDVESGSKIKELLLERNVRSVAISPDGKSAVSAADTLKLWDLATGQALREFKGSARSYHVAYSPDGRTVLSDHSDNSLKLWDLATGAVAMTLKGHCQAGSVVGQKGRAGLSGRARPFALSCFEHNKEGSRQAAASRGGATAHVLDALPLTTTDDPAGNCDSPPVGCGLAG